MTIQLQGFVTGSREYYLIKDAKVLNPSLICHISIFLMDRGLLSRIKKCQDFLRGNFAIFFPVPKLEWLTFQLEYRNFGRSTATNRRPPKAGSAAYVDLGDCVVAIQTVQIGLIKENKQGKRKNLACVGMAAEHQVYAVMGGNMFDNIRGFPGHKTPRIWFSTV